MTYLETTMPGKAYVGNPPGILTMVQEAHKKKSPSSDASTLKVTEVVQKKQHSAEYLAKAREIVRDSVSQLTGSETKETYQMLFQEIVTALYPKDQAPAINFIRLTDIYAATRVKKQVIFSDYKELEKEIEKVNQLLNSKVFPLENVSPEELTSSLVTISQTVKTHENQAKKLTDEANHRGMHLKQQNDDLCSILIRVNLSIKTLEWKLQHGTMFSEVINRLKERTEILSKLSSDVSTMQNQFESLENNEEYCKSALALKNERFKELQNKINEDKLLIESTLKGLKEMIQKKETQSELLGQLQEADLHFPTNKETIEKEILKFQQAKDIDACKLHDEIAGKFLELNLEMAALELEIDKLLAKGNQVFGIKKLQQQVNGVENLISAAKKSLSIEITQINPSTELALKAEMDTVTQRHQEIYEAVGKLSEESKLTLARFWNKLSGEKSRNEELLKLLSDYAFFDEGEKLKLENKLGEISKRLTEEIRTFHTLHETALFNLCHEADKMRWKVAVTSIKENFSLKVQFLNSSLALMYSELQTQKNALRTGSPLRKTEKAALQPISSEVSDSMMSSNLEDVKTPSDLKTSVAEWASRYNTLKEKAVELNKIMINTRNQLDDLISGQQVKNTEKAKLLSHQLAQFSPVESAMKTTHTDKVTKTFSDKQHDAIELKNQLNALWDTLKKELSDVASDINRLDDAVKSNGAIPYALTKTIKTYVGQQNLVIPPQLI